MVSYVLYDGDLYRIFIQNEMTGAAQAVNDFLGSVAALKREIPPAEPGTAGQKFLPAHAAE